MFSLLFYNLHWIRIDQNRQNFDLPSLLVEEILTIVIYYVLIQKPKYCDTYAGAMSYLTNVSIGVQVVDSVV